MTTPTDAELIEWLKFMSTNQSSMAGPERYKLLHDRLAALLEENERLREALEKYANEKNWHCTEFGEYHEHGEKCCKDGWWTRSENGYDIAREALKEKP